MWSHVIVQCLKAVVIDEYLSQKNSLPKDTSNFLKCRQPDIMALQVGEGSVVKEYRVNDLKISQERFDKGRQYTIPLDKIVA